MATVASSSSPAPASAPERQWLIMGRIARVKEEGNFSVDVAAPPLVSFVTVPKSLYTPPKDAGSDKRHHAAGDEDRSALSIATSQQPGVANLAALPFVSFPTVPRSLHQWHPPKDADSDKGHRATADEDRGSSGALTIAVAQQRPVPNLTAPTTVHTKPNPHDSASGKYPYGVAAEGEDRENQSAAVALKPRVPKLSAPFGAAKADDDTGKLSYVFPADDASFEGTGKHIYGVADDYTVKQPYIVAADDACLLFQVAVGPFIDFDSCSGPRRILFVAHSFVPADPATQLDVPIADIVHISDRCLDQPGISDIANVGIISIPGSDGAEFEVAELRLVNSADGEIDRATLLSFRSGEESWIERDLRCSSSPRGWPKLWHDVIAHNGTLWWVNLVWGMLGCNMFANDHELDLRHMKLPASAGNGAVESLPNAEINRMVRVSQGHLMCVEISSDPASDAEETVVIISLLKFKPEGQSSWELGSTSNLGTIWASESYRRTGMPKEVPVLTLLHPSNTDIVYLALKKYVFSVNLADCRVLQCVEMVDQPISWRHALAWELPASLAYEIRSFKRCNSATAEGEGCTGLVKDGVVQGAKSRLHCVACKKGTGGKICGRCTRLIKKQLLGVARKAMLVPGNHDLRYCLVCHELKRKHRVHEHEHEPNCIPISSYGGDLVAWASGKEPWASILVGIQSDRCQRPILGRPYLLYSSKQIRCEVCSDLLTTDGHCEYFVAFCSIKCWARDGGVADVPEWIEELVAIDFDDGTNAFCLTCAVAFHRKDDDEHKVHQYIGIIPDSLGRRPRVQLPLQNQLLHMWDTIIKQEDRTGGTVEMLIRDDRSVRCRGCKMRLLDGGGDACSFECALPRPPPLLPKPLLYKQK